MSYSDLRNSIQGNTWLGKSILEISDTVLDLVNGTNWILGFDAMKSIANSPLNFITEAIDKDNSLTSHCSVLFLETSYAINKAYNSDIYTDLEAKGNSESPIVNLSNKDICIYNNAVKGNNNLVEYLSIFETLSAGVPIFSVTATMNSARNNAIAIVGDLLDNLKALLSELLGIEKKTKAQRKKISAYKSKVKRLEKIKSAMEDNAKQNVKEYFAPKSVAIVPIAVGGVATVSATITIIKDIASWLLSNFFVQSFLVPISALAYSVTAIVIKYLSGVGGETCRYLVGGILRSVQAALPSLIAPTGLFAGCWALLQAYAPYIIMCAVVVIILMRPKSTIGEHLYVVGQSSLGNVLSTAKLYDTDRIEMLSELKSLADEIREESIHGYESLFGFAMNEKDEVVMCHDLINDLPITGNAIAPIYALCQPIITNGVLV